MKKGDQMVVDGVRVTLLSRAPNDLSTHLYDKWWVTRPGPNGAELWAMGRERKHGRFTRNWRLIGRYSWRDKARIYEG